MVFNQTAVAYRPSTVDFPLLFASESPQVSHAETCEMLFEALLPGRVVCTPCSSRQHLAAVRTLADKHTRAILRDNHHHAIVHDEEYPMHAG